MTLGAPARDAAAALVRAKIADGTLLPGMLAPSAARLARETGRNPHTCQAALRALVADGTLAPPVSPAARPHVPCDRETQDAGAALRAKLSAALRARRKAAGMTQQVLAGKLGVSVTTIGHAETGRTWHSREFWRRAGILLGDGGALLRLYDGLKGPVPGPPPPVLPLSVAITADGVLVTWPDGTQNLIAPPP